MIGAGTIGLMTLQAALMARIAAEVMVIEPRARAGPRRSARTQVRRA